MIRRLCIIGGGLLGGARARARRSAHACGEVVGAGRRQQSLQTALRLGVIDRFEIDPARAADGADMVVVAVPLGAMEGVFRSLSGVLGADAVLTDVGSAKRSVLEAARAAFGEVPARLVPGHPIAGTERSGVEASFDSLFRDQRVILTPAPHTETRAVSRVQAMWESTGARVECMAPDHHDQVLAATSHLPHILAYTLVDVLGRMEQRAEVFRYAAGGFRDFTRIASSDPRMWHDICLANRDALVSALEHFERELGSTVDAIRRGDGESVLALLERAKRLRDRYAGGGS